ncbi:ABC transporter substrate-binding protein [Alicyclobacillaceae bacterium I2511]|nr:ABC transporter substrate-binding protein [Alicyclobacillaceae bacterium I2511]
MIKKNAHRNFFPRIWTPLILLMLTGAGLTACGTVPQGTGSVSSKGTSSAGSVVTNSGPQAVRQETTYPLTVTDEAGRTVILPKAPHHIASVTEGTDEILAGLVPKQDIAMVTSYATNPDYSNIVSFAKGIPAIVNANSEQIIALHPDLVLLASYTQPAVIAQIMQTRVPVYEFNDFNSITNIEQNIQIVGRLVDQPIKAENMVKTMNQQLQEIQQAVQGKSHPSVLDYSSFGFAAGKNTTVNEMITDAGGTNAATSLQGWQKITAEQVVKMNPTVIIDATDDQGFIRKLLQDPQFQNVAAVKNRQVYAIDSADLASVSQSITRGVWDIAHVLHARAKLPSKPTTLGQ